MKTSLTLLGFWFLVACGSSSVAAPVDLQDASAEDSGRRTQDAASETADAQPNPSCHAIPGDGAQLYLEATNAPVPSPQGGQIAQGTYELSKAVVHTSGPGGGLMPPFGSGVLVVGAGTMQAVFTEPDGQQRRITYGFQIEEKTLRLKVECKHPIDAKDADAVIGYSAQPQELTWHLSAAPLGTFIYTFTKREL
jgi:hypothetical protein